ncbi:MULTISPECIES: MFS transporter [unclassified Pseudomonas]|uniref:MFS transporter n=1 Tax=unclassified Pseudomonas TaxID=196821 RepID=UPI000DA6E5E3|nr:MULTISPECIES: MFS transporter [unclassified Pseudomonas]MDW3711808.1 MFS transporter [Pseudomonas sp. 2023EL-01195]PZE13970.1 MFS transporter [Pseudomonas sp. 57B-090624]
MPVALYALTAGAFGIGVTEFIIMGLLLEVGGDLGVSISAAGLLISGYALGVVAGAPLLTALSARWPRKTTLLALMVIFTLGNLACALAPDYTTLMIARVLTSFAHGTFFGVGSVVATSLVAADRRASAIAVMFTGLTVATILGVPFGTWLGQAMGWRAAFWAVTVVGVVALVIIALFVPRDREKPAPSSLREDFRVLGRPAVLLGLLTTVLGFGGVFTVFSYIAPLLTRVSGFGEAAVSPVLLVFGAGLVLGNLLGGRLADRRLLPALLGSMAALAVVLGLMGFVLENQVAVIVFTFLLGVAGFATVPPLQIWVLEKAEGAGQSVAASFNIAAFNLGNALGAWLGGSVIDQGPGLIALPWAAASLPILALAVALFALRLEKRRDARLAVA